MRKLALASAAFSAAVFFSRYILTAPFYVYGAAVCATLAFSGFFFRGSVRTRIVIVSLSLTAGFLWTAVYTSVFFKPSESFAGTTQTVTATALGAPEQTDYGSRLLVCVKQDGSADVKTRLYIFDDVPDIQAGNTLSFTARFKLADTVYGETTDGYFAKGIYLLAYAEGGVVITNDTTPLRYLPAHIADLSAQMIDRIFPSHTRDFMRALLLGDTSGVYSDPALSSSMSTAGASHIVAVSGMHLSFIVGFLNVIIKKKRRLTAAAIPVIFFFMAIVGFRPSLARAGIMQLFLLSAPLFKRDSDVFTSLPASLMLILLFNPYAATSAGLQLSFASTFGIALFTEKIYTRLDEPLRFRRIYQCKPLQYTIRLFIGGLAATLGALAFSVPLTALHFGTVSIIAPVTNLLILLPTAVAFIGGMLSLAAGFVFAPFGIAIAFLTALPARLILLVINYLARLPFAAVYTSNTAVVVWLVYVWSMLLALWIFRARARQLIVPACLAAVSLCMILVGSSILSVGGTRITALDVGQGQCIVLMSGQYTAVIDCGSNSGKDAGDLLVRYLKNHGRSRIDLLVLTHFHTDHAGGVESVLWGFPVTAIAMPDTEDDDKLQQSIASLAYDKGIQTVYVSDDLQAQLGDMYLSLYEPVGDADENERGIVILASKDDFDLLITGDIGADTERRLLSLTTLPDIEVLIAGHHGSKHATCDELLDAVTPETALISVGYNSYGHPAPETLLRLVQAGIVTYRTDILGNITIKVQ